MDRSPHPIPDCPPRRAPAWQPLLQLIPIVGAAVVLLLAASSPAAAQQEGGVFFPAFKELTGTLAKVARTGTITLGYRENALPFSFLGPAGQPIGYSLDLCREIVNEIADELGSDQINIVLRPVTPAGRIPKLTAGEIDLECGSSTNTLARRREVAFSPIIFVAGTRLMVERSASIRSLRDLRGKTVVVTTGTTNEAAVRSLSEKQGLDIKLITTADHDQSFAAFREGKAEAFATDDVLLYGLIAKSGTQKDYKVVGDLLSYEPYGLMFRKDDPDFAAIVERTFRRLAKSRELVWTYNAWFLRPLPSGERLGIPMSPQLTEIFHTLGLPE
ncbi:MAG: amino acid ABC transporter substrate-binding protein [Rhodospirillales bacterium]|nr:amino acid ABC transporter substrate-binding protein [Rhodospirillales bacterium]